MSEYKESKAKHLEDEMRNQRKQASQGRDRMLYCRNCMQEQEVYSGAGHKPNEMNLHCVECGNFVTRLKKNYKGEWELDMSVYKH